MHIHTLFPQFLFRLNSILYTSQDVIPICQRRVCVGHIEESVDAGEETGLHTMENGLLFPFIPISQMDMGIYHMAPSFSKKARDMKVPH